MRIAYVIYPESIVLNRANGIRNQAIKWANCLRQYANVDLISSWDPITWKCYDVIHFFGGDQWLGFIPDLKRINPNIVFSPILDSIEPKWKIRILANLGFKGYHHPQNTYKEYVNNFKALFVRSLYEAEYFLSCYRVARERIKLVPIAYEISPLESESEKEHFCLHISSLYQPRKNVIRLIEAAKKYHFELLLGGSLGSQSQSEKLYNAIGDNKNIRILGYLSQDEMCELYRKAKVFALPSINEGVGIVALNAGVAGANVVITKVGGPHEYFNGLAYEIDPYSIDDIGLSIVKAMSDNDMQPGLKEHLIKNYSEQVIAHKLYEAYRSLVE